MTLPAWCTPLADAQRMRAIDSWAIQRMGMAGLELMERAGAAVASAVEELAPDGEVTVVCGKGNNGGDGFVVARLLRDRGRSVTVLCTAAGADYSGDAATNLGRLPGQPPTLIGNGTPALGAAAVVVDALLGTGFDGTPRGAVAAAIAAINASGARVVSVDVPSGVDASSGVVAGEAVRATTTVTFAFGKPGLWIAPGKSHAGVVRTVDIGIPRGALEATAPEAVAPEFTAPGVAGGSDDAGRADHAEIAPQRRPGPAGLIDDAVSGLLPRRGQASTKFSSGHVLVVGGSVGMTGAPRMTAEAAARAGAGYVTVAVPASLQPIVAASVAPELMVRPVPDRDGNHGRAGLQGLLAMAQRSGAVALGNGLGADEDAAALSRELAAALPKPLVLDADGLNAHAGHIDDLARRPGPTVMTPHAGELGRLLECPSADIERERLGSVRVAAQRARAVVVLKGDDTLVCAPDGMVAVSRGDVPALATAGTGDVLAGVIAALLAAGLDGFAAAAAGVWLHARAGVQAARRQGSAEGVIATDVIAALPAVRVPGSAA